MFAKINEIEFLGSFQRVYFETKDVSDELVMVDIPSSVARKIKLIVNDDINLFFSKEDTKVYSI